MKVQLEGNDRLLFRCPGCNHSHVITYGPNGIWTYNENPDKPTFRPSVLYTSQRLKLHGAELSAFMYERTLVEPKPPIEYVPTVCHSFVTDGMIQFLDDCTHDLKGQTVELPDF